MNTMQIHKIALLFSQYGIKEGAEIVGKNGNKIKIVDFDFGRDRIKVELESAAADSWTGQTMEIPCMMVVDLCDAVCK